MHTEPPIRLSIPAWRNSHYISLAEILLNIGKSLINMQWFVRIDEAAPEPGAEQLEALLPTTPLSIFELLHLVTPSIQIIDGEITAKDETKTENPYLVIRAVDSTSWDIETNLDHIAHELKQPYPELTIFTTSNAGEINTHKTNKIITILTQAMLGAISENFRMVAIDLESPIWKISFFLAAESEIDREEIEDIISNFEVCMMDVNIECSGFVAEIFVVPTNISLPKIKELRVFQKREANSSLNQD